jgi:hypothetical protein
MLMDFPKPLRDLMPSCQLAHAYVSRNSDVVDIGRNMQMKKSATSDTLCYATTHRIRKTVQESVMFLAADHPLLQAAILLVGSDVFDSEA